MRNYAYSQQHQTNSLQTVKSELSCNTFIVGNVWGSGVSLSIIRADVSKSTTSRCLLLNHKVQPQMNRYASSKHSLLYLCELFFSEEKVRSHDNNWQLMGRKIHDHSRVLSIQGHWSAGCTRAGELAPCCFHAWYTYAVTDKTETEHTDTRALDSKTWQQQRFEWVNIWSLQVSVCPSLLSRDAT